MLNRALQGAGEARHEPQAGGQRQGKAEEGKAEEGKGEREGKMEEGKVGERAERQPAAATGVQAAATTAQSSGEGQTERDGSSEGNDCTGLSQQGQGMERGEHLQRHQKQKEEGEGEEQQGAAKVVRRKLLHPQTQTTYASLVKQVRGGGGKGGVRRARVEKGRKRERGVDGS